MDTLVFYMKKIYGSQPEGEDEKRIKAVKNCLIEIYNEYSLKVGNELQTDGTLVYGESTSRNTFEGTSTNSYIGDLSYVPAVAAIENELEVYLQSKSAQQPTKNDLETYLSEKLHPMIDTFYILAWRKLQGSKYPIVASMARDILVVPASTIASESTFSTGGRVLDQYRCSMHPNTVEAVICGQYWLRSELHGRDISELTFGTTKDDVDDGANIEINDIDLVEQP